MRYRGLAPIYGLMAKNIRVNGSTTRCTEMVISGGPMAKNIMDNSWKTNATDSANLGGRTEENMKESGAVENNMVLVSTEMVKAKSVEENGSTEEGYSGLADSLPSYHNFV